MALLARGREFRRHMVRGLRRLVIDLVTLITIWIGAQGTVVKERAGKGRGGVAILTGMRKIHRHVIRRFVVIGLMAGITIYRGSAKVFDIRSGMALDALDSGVNAGQRESSPRVLAEGGFDRGPIHLAVTFLTIQTEGALMHILVTSAATSRDQAIRGRAILMAEQAGDFGVRPFQGILRFL